VPAAPVANPPAPVSNQPSTPTPRSTTTTTTAPTPAAAPAAEGAGFGDPSAFLIGNRSENAVREMEAMGFARPEIDRALRAAFYNPERAIEYLLSGIPENIQAEQRQATPAGGAQGNPTSPPAAQPAQPAPAAAAAPATGDEPINLFEAAAQAGQNRAGGAGARRAGAGAGAGGLTAEGGANIDFLRNSPHFQQLRQFVQQQPAMLEPILQQLAEGNPELAQMIGSNQDQFLQLLAEVCAVKLSLLFFILTNLAGYPRRGR
jgi:UV excision repair protein RAD23